MLVANLKLSFGLLKKMTSFTLENYVFWWWLINFWGSFPNFCHTFYMSFWALHLVTQLVVAACEGLSAYLTAERLFTCCFLFPSPSLIFENVTDTKSWHLTTCKKRVESWIIRDRFRFFWTPTDAVTAGLWFLKKLQHESGWVKLMTKYELSEEQIDRSTISDQELQEDDESSNFWECWEIWLTGRGCGDNGTHGPAESI